MLIDATGQMEIHEPKNGSEDVETGQKKTTQHSLLPEVIRDKIEHFSMHGTGNVVRASTKRRKTTWLLIVLVCLTVLLVQCVDLAIQYLKYETVVNVNIKEEKKSTFPAVTVCNLNAYRKSQVKERLEYYNAGYNIRHHPLPPPLILKDDVEKFQYKLVPTFIKNETGNYIDMKVVRETVLERNTPPIPEFEAPTIQAPVGIELYVMKYISLFEDNSNESGRAKKFISDLFPQIDTTYPNADLVDALGDWEARKEAIGRALLMHLNNINRLKGYATSAKTDMGHSAENMIFGCQFGQKSCTWRNFTQFTNDQYGNCFTFEPRKELMVTRNENDPQNGLKIYLYTEPDEYLDYYTETEGFRLTVQDKSQPPYPMADGMNIEPGTELEIAVSATVTTEQEAPYDTRCEELSAEEQQKRDLYYDFFPTESDQQANVADDDSRHVMVQYSRSGCMSTCFQRHMLNSCGCIFSGTTIQNLSPYNGILPDFCPYLNSTYVKCYTGVLNSFFQTEFNCDCPPACRRREYNIERVSSSKWPSESNLLSVWGKLMRHLPNTTFQHASDVSGKTSRLIVYLSTTDVTHITHKPTIEISSLLGTVGGSIGMYLGVSVIAICELVEFCLDMFCGKKNNYNKNEMRPKARIDQETG